MSVRTGLEATTSKFEIFFALNCKLADIIIILYYTLPVLCCCGLIYQVIQLFNSEDGASIIARPMLKGTVPFGLQIQPLWSGLK